MGERIPKVVILAGPNGAGKTTASKLLLHGALEVDEFVNADIIARGLSGFNPESVAGEAGRIMLARLDVLGAANTDFAFETTLASRSFAPRVRRLIAKGYRFYLIFLYLPDPLQAVARVAERVVTGGHHVPPEIVIRRHERGLLNFFELFQKLAHEWYFYANIGGPPRLIASGGADVEEIVGDQVLWTEIRSRYGKKR